MPRVSDIYERYLEASFRHPWRVLLVAATVTAVAVLGATRLELRTDLRELLPRDYRSIEDLERIEKRVGGLGTLVVAVESDDRQANLRFVEDLAANLRRFPREEIHWVDYHVRDERAFLERNKLLYVDHADLVTFRDRLKAKIDEERRKHDPFALDLEEPAPPAPPLNIEEYERKYRGKLATLDKYPGGYYLSRDGRLASIYIRVPGSATGVDAARRLCAKVEALVASMAPERYHPSLKISFGGDIRTTIEEYDATKEDLFLVSGVCIGLVLAVIVLFFLNVRSLFALGVPLLMGTAWTFGLTAAAIGFLNASTMFLASIVAGNGINFGIILLARYFEERRAGLDVRAALSVATRHTARATAVASMAAGVAYGSLLATDFRGFNQFGFIGGVGMVLCWIAAFAVTPSVIALSERIRPFVRGPARRPRWSPFSAAFAALSTRFPRTVIAAGVLSVAIAGWLGAVYLRGDPFLYNFRYLRNVESRDSGAGAVVDRVQTEIGQPATLPNGMIVLADRLSDVPLIEAALVARREAAPRGQEPIGEVATIYGLLPTDQERKIPVLREIRKLLTGSTLKFLTPEQRRKARELTPPADLRPIGISDLPEKMARPFTDVDGNRGLLLYVALAPRMSGWDGRDLILFASAVREVRLPTGQVVHASGAPVIFADMMRAVLTDGPRAALLCFLGVVLLVVVAFRRLSLTLLVLGALVTGVLWLLGAMGGWDWLVRHLQSSGAQLSETFVNAIPKINFLNFIVLPLTIGIGVDYAVNVVQRYHLEGEGSMRKAIESTGGAVVLCSLTTIIGYSALLLSNNLALVSFGKLANLGEIACLLAALCLLPSAAILVERARARRVAKAREARREAA